MLTYPPDFALPHEKVKTAEIAAACIAGLATDRRAVVQAGGCAGLWPLALSKYFEAVYTFEPDHANFQCLVRNCEAPNIYPFRAALGWTAQRAGLDRPKPGAGLWHLAGDGTVPVLPLDAFALSACDALVLDVEGSEVRALQGAEETLARCRPVLWFEFIHNTTAIEAFVTAHGYTRPERGIGGDYYSVHASRIVH